MHDIRIGDTVQLRKAHPCGGDLWRVVRVGADVGLRCLTCDRKVMLPRRTFERRLRSVRHADRHPSGTGRDDAVADTSDTA